MQNYATFEGSTVQFCRDFGIPQQTFYSQLKRHQVATISKRRFTRVTPTNDAFSFVSAQVTPSAITLQHQQVKLSLPAQCDPTWLAALLKELSA